MMKSTADLFNLQTMLNYEHLWLCYQRDLFALLIWKYSELCMTDGGSTLVPGESAALDRWGRLSLWHSGQELPHSLSGLELQRPPTVATEPLPPAQNERPGEVQRPLLHPGPETYSMWVQDTHLFLPFLWHTQKTLLKFSHSNPKFMVRCVVFYLFYSQCANEAILLYCLKSQSRLIWSYWLDWTGLDVGLKSLSDQNQLGCFVSKRFKIIKVDWIKLAYCRLHTLVFGFRALNEKFFNISFQIHCRPNYLGALHTKTHLTWKRACVFNSWQHPGERNQPPSKF